MIKVATMRIMDDFRNKWKPSSAYHKIDTFRGEQRWMGHKGGPLVLAIVELHESEDIRQAVCQSVENSVIKVL